MAVVRRGPLLKTSSRARDPLGTLELNTLRLLLARRTFVEFASTFLAIVRSIRFVKERREDALPYVNIPFGCAIVPANAVWIFV
jgi:hypothetical protein